MASFKVRIFPGPVDYEALHAAKLIDFPLEPRDYKPFSQARVCFANDERGCQRLVLQLLSFEAAPLPDSAMRVIFRFPGLADPLRLTIYADGRFDGPKDCEVQRYEGEDLQGVYWGANITIPAMVYAPFVPAPDRTFSGNFYKICKNPVRPHYGSFYAADFGRELAAPENLGGFVCIGY